MGSLCFVFSQEVKISSAFLFHLNVTVQIHIILHLIKFSKNATYYIFSARKYLAHCRDKCVTEQYKKQFCIREKYNLRKLKLLTRTADDLYTFKGKKCLEPFYLT